MHDFTRLPQPRALDVPSLWSWLATLPPAERLRALADAVERQLPKGRPVSTDAVLDPLLATPEGITS
ncbi:hypothetical protein [Streptomyces orinoci]|uniref:Uncharacterized protein n=1 Tax=Streptomyces orinoci TaxID=67339 RepID=A0ABV3K1Y1_STRON|nr:hypothetical protein [Streptomyces orinoci]